MWTVESLNETVDEELQALPADMRARLTRICELISTVGLERVGAPHVRHLRGPLWEMRMSGRAGIIACGLYRKQREQENCDRAAFIKKTMKTPRREIDLALRRAKEVTG